VRSYRPGEREEVRAEGTRERDFGLEPEGRAESYFEEQRRSGGGGSAGRRGDGERGEWEQRAGEGLRVEAES